jgi:hypothetical protein
MLFIKRSFGRFRSILQRNLAKSWPKRLLFGLAKVGQLEFVVRHYSGDRVSVPIGVGFKTSQPVASLTWRIVKEGSTSLTLQG